MLLKITDSWGSGIVVIALAVLAGLVGLGTLFALSLHWLLERRTRKRGLIALGIFLLVVGLLALLIYA